MSQVALTNDTLFTKEHVPQSIKGGMLLVQIPDLAGAAELPLGEVSNPKNCPRAQRVLPAAPELLQC